ncbi:hypothetical protein ACQPZF_11310 [Actinosynnema sp. CS-041913]|uniref:hypothetical protein n=1 Tax=Actinosynnema sp. CS-041913 TaxID=3239917 RepID=UPI003D91B409
MNGRQEAGRSPGRDHELRETHLHTDAPDLTSTPAALVAECLYKAPQSRPNAANLLKRLERAAEKAPPPGPK